MASLGGRCIVCRRAAMACVCGPLPPGFLTAAALRRQREAAAAAFEAPLAPELLAAGAAGAGAAGAGAAAPSAPPPLVDLTADSD